jgi:GNAT superfamily N-acetyltransferase
MIAKSWLRFEWALAAVPEVSGNPHPPMALCPPQPGEESEVLSVMGKAVALDSSLGDAGRSLQVFFTELAPRMWKNKNRQMLAIYHGERMIGASVFLPEADAPYQLLSGPCVLSEYGGRGLGTWLLQETLWRLREAGLTTAAGVCKEHGTLAKYVYPKFGGVSCFIEHTVPTD